MIATYAATSTDTQTAVPAILAYCSNDNEVLRCAAIRALATQGTDDAAIRSALLTAILDEDPDVRSDAMEALVDLAHPQDAPALRASLQGDPVREVKLAAIRALSRFQDDATIQLLRDLMLSRCEDTVAWEDELDDWEDWLDIQTACIQALGGMAATGTLDDMFNALNDEFGQTLDIPVFTAFAQMGSDGVPWLLAQIELGTDLACSRAAQALLRADPMAILDFADTLLKSPDTRLKLLTISVLPDTDTRLRPLFEDADPAVRSAILKRLAQGDPALVHRALSDTEQSVQATALNLLRFPLEPDFHAALIDNVLAWLDTASTELASAAADLLPRIAPDKCEVALTRLATSDDRPLELRVAAVRALSHPDVPNRLAHLKHLLSNSAQQVRVAALHGAKLLANDGDDTAIALLAQTITGQLLSPQDRVQKRAPQEDADVTAPKDDGFGASRVRITPDGDIVTEDTETQPEPNHPVSTLSAIQFDTPPVIVEPVLAEATPEESSAKKRKRRAVEGPETVNDDLSCVAMTQAFDLPSPQVEQALLTRLNDSDEPLRAVAWKQMAQRGTSYSLAEAAKTAAMSALKDTNPAIRLAAFHILQFGDNDPAVHAMALADEDALVRASGVAMLPVAQALAYICDDAAAVRDAALQSVMDAADTPHAQTAVDNLLKSEHISTLAKAIHQSSAAHIHAANVLGSDNLTPRNALVLIEAFAHAQPN